jgi:predicted transcriptional regulator
MDTEALVLCPICGTSARAVANPDVYFVCGVCGAPSLGPAPQLGHFEVSSRDRDQLREVSTLRKRARFGRWGVAVLTTTIFLQTVIGVLVATLSHKWWAMGSLGSALASTPLLLVSWINSRNILRRISTTRDDLWQRAALALLRERGSLTAPALAEAYGVTTATAEGWLQTLATTNGVELSDPTAAGESQYTWTGAEGVRLRVDAAPTPAGAHLTPELAAELREFDEQLAAETAAGERRKMQEPR